MMDRHTCKLCFRRFSNGRALGGHMRSHVTFANPKPQMPGQQDPASPSSSASASHGEPEASEQVGEVADQAAAALMVDREVVGQAEEAKQLAFYGLRENPRKSFRLVDPEFSSNFPPVDYAAAAGGSSVVLQDRESETESSKPPSLRRRSKRRRRASPLPTTKSEPSIEPEPVSSISDATQEEDVARCLMMLSRDVWDNSSSPAAKSKNSNRDEVEEEEEEAEDDEEEPQQQSDESEEELVSAVRSRRGGRSRYQCGTCRKVFRSYQALGGHRASHKKVRACVVAPPVVEEEEHDDAHQPHLDNRIPDADSEVNAAPSTGSTDRRIHECPVCFRIFSSGQALGGHKRSHLSYASGTGNPSPVVLSVSAAAAAAPGVAATITAAASATAAAISSTVHANNIKKPAGESLIDLNLPPPMDEEVEMSAVCDAEQ